MPSPGGGKLYGDISPGRSSGFTKGASTGVPGVAGSTSGFTSGFGCTGGLWVLEYRHFFCWS
ncbi:hypothetical protein [Mucilaginibacter flavidus]|uniref:hypothetical protein n=1 Tax=Mucilaginibacter flavidus TaxID=2949309 RepID=UPI0020923A75|nr:hypothetical protein [Mucilaginibacter flavidus]